VFGDAEEEEEFEEAEERRAGEARTVTSAGARATE
jgi:hypothetical protein